MLDANRNEDGTVDASNEGFDEITKKTSRKRARKEEGWNINVKSRTYQTGQVRKYKGEERARSVRGRCKPTCRRNCSQISNEQQQDIHNMFWSIGDATRRHDFMIHNVRRVAKKRTTTEKNRRANSQFYFLPLGGSDTSVCKPFFMNTLDVSHMYIGYALGHCEHGLISPNAPKVAQNKTSDERMERIREHINSFPVTDSHYCRKDTKRQYLEEGLSVNAMYRLYCD